MKKVLIAVLAILLLPSLCFAAEAIFSNATLASGSSATSNNFTIPDGAKEAGIIAIITGSTDTRILLFGCRGTGDKECIGDNITIANAYTNSNSEAGTITYNKHMGDNASSATSAITANTVTNTISRSSIYLSDNMSKNGGTGADGKFFFSVPVANFPPADHYVIKAYERSATAGTITMEVTFR